MSEKRKQVVHLITGLERAGAEMMLYKLLSRMDRSEFENTLISMTDKGALGSSIEALGIPVYTLGMRRGIPGPFSMLKLLRLLWKIGPAILQTWLYHADFLGLIIGKIARVPAIVWNVRCSDLRQEDHSLRLFWTIGLLARFAAVPKAVVINSRSGRIAHEKVGYKPTRWELIPNGFDLDLFCPDPQAGVKLRVELGLPAETQLVGLIARYNPMKDHPNFLKAAGLLIQTSSNIHYVLVGQGIDDRNEALTMRIASLGLTKHVHLLGERKDVANIIKGLDIATLASYSEGFPNAIGEAMACGVPCIVTNVGDAAHLVGDAGRIVPPHNPAALAAGWAALLQLDSKERAVLAHAGRRRISDYFSLERVVTQYENLYRELLGA